MVALQRFLQMRRRVPYRGVFFSFERPKRRRRSRTLQSRSVKWRRRIPSSSTLCFACSLVVPEFETRLVDSGTSSRSSGAVPPARQDPQHWDLLFHHSHVPLFWLWFVLASPLILMMSIGSFWAASNAVVMRGRS